MMTLAGVILHSPHDRKPFLLCHRDFPQEALDKLMADQASGSASGSGGTSGEENRAPLNPWQVSRICTLHLLVLL